MTATAMHAGHRLLVHWVRLVHRSALLVLVVALLATFGAAYVTLTRMGINTSTTDMLSEKLPFRRHDRALSRAFPQFSDNLTVVVEGATPDLAEDAALRLATELGARPLLFRDVFYPRGDAFFRRNGLLYLDMDELEALGDRLAEAQPLLSALGEDLSLRGLAGVLRLAFGEGRAEDDGSRAEEAAVAVAPVLEKLAAAADALAAQQAGGAPAHPMSWRALLSGKDPEPADKRRFIVLRPALDFASLEPAAHAVEALRGLAGELGLTEENGLRVRLTGEAIMFQEELRSVRDGMGVVGLLSICLVVGLLILGLRSLRLVGATLATLAMGLVWTAGFATLAVGELNLISVAFAVLFIGLSVDFGIHFALRYKEAIEAQAPGDADPGEALTEAARGVGGALTLCAAAAAIGFFAFLPTSYRGVAELGLISGVGMFIALFANLTVLPAILSLAPLAPGGRVLRSPFGDLTQRLAARRPRWVIGGAFALGLGAAALLPFAWFDDDPMSLRDPGSESVATLLDLFDDPRVTPYSAQVLAVDLAAGEALAARLEELPEVDSAVVLSDLVPARQDDKLEIVDEIGIFLAPVFDTAGSAPRPNPAESRQALRDLRASLETAGRRLADDTLAGGARRLAAALDALAARDGTAREANLSTGTLAELERVWLGALPARLAALGAALEADTVTLEDLPEGIRTRNLSADGRARVEIAPREDLRDPAARRRFVDAVRRVAPAVAGAPVTITEAGRAVVQAFGEAAVITLVLIVILLLMRLRSIRDSLMALAPLALAALLTVGATIVFAIPFNFANVIVLPLLFGLGVASGIHMVTRARHAGAAGLMATSTPRAVLFSALTTIGSFCALALSSHRGTSSMGILLTIAITLTMVCTLVVLPALLTRFAQPAAAVRRPGIIAPVFRALKPGRLLALLAGIGLLAYIASRTDLAEVWSRLAELGAWGALAVCAVYFMVFLADTASWQLMLPSVRLDAPWLYRLWKVRMVGEALNLVVPAGSLGGEPFKAVLLKRLHAIGYREGAASLFIAKTVNLLALVVFSAVGFAIMLRVDALPETYVLAAGSGLVALSLGVGGFYAVQRWRGASYLTRRLAAWRMSRRLADFLEHVHHVDDHFERFYARRPARFAAAFALALANWLIGMGELIVVMWFLGAPVTLAEAWLIETAVQLVRAGAFFIPASLGATEAVMVLVYDALTGRPSLGFAVALVRRARELLWIAWGLWLGWLEAPGAAAAEAAGVGTGRAQGGTQGS